MSANYSIDQTTKALVFTGKPQSLDGDSIRKADRNEVTSIIIPNSVSIIWACAFSWCYTVAFVHIPNSVSRINDWSFANCTGIGSVHIPNSASTVNGWSFANCTGIASIHIPNSILTVDNGAFDRCLRLHKTFIPNSKIRTISSCPSFSPRTSLLRPRIKPLVSLQKKSACRVSKTTYSIYL